MVRDKSGLHQLLPPEPPQESDTNDALTGQPDPEPRIMQSRERYGEVRKYRARPIRIRRTGPPHDRGHRPQHLRAYQGEADVEPRQRLQ